MNRIHHLLGSISLSVLGFLTPSAALADEVKITPPIGGDILPGSANLTEDIRSSMVFSTLLPFVIKYLIGLAAALSVIAIMIGGYQYLTAYGNEEGNKKAIKTLTWAVGGLIICITAYGIVALISSLKFS